MIYYPFILAVILNFLTELIDNLTTHEPVVLKSYVNGILTYEQ